MSNPKEIQVDANYHYKFHNYLDVGRWNSYYYQIAETLAFEPQSVLIIGVGDNIVGNLLSMQGIKVSTFDFDEKLVPDFLGNIIEIDKVLQGMQFDVLLCCQILEHLPFALFEDILEKLKVVSKNIIISLPYASINYKLELKLPIIKTVKLNLNIQRFFKEHQFNGEHYWEIGYKGYSKIKITRVIANHFTIRKRFVASHNHYHLFYVLNNN